MYALLGESLLSSANDEAGSVVSTLLISPIGKIQPGQGILR